MITRARRLLLHLRRWAGRPGLRLALFTALSLAASWAPLGQVGAVNDFYDAHLVQPYEDGAVRTVLQYGQLPLWNPWVCGGTYAPAGPYSRFQSPSFLLSLALGGRGAEALTFFLLLLIGMEGTFRWTRLRTGSTLGALLAAPFFGLCSFFAISWSLGWIIFVGFVFTPWALLGAARICRGEPIGIAILAGSFALMLGFGGTYPVPLSAIAVALELGRGVLERPFRAWKRVAWLIGAAALFTIGLSAFRFWPVLETMGVTPRVMAGSPAHSPGELITVMFWPFVGDPVFYLGLPLVALLLPAALAWRKAIPPLLFFGVMFWLALGYWPRPWPAAFAALRELPLFGSLRYPERFLIPAAAYLVELAALGAAVVIARARRVRWLVPVALGLCGVAGAGWAVQLVQFRPMTERPWLAPAVPIVDQPFAQARGNRWAQTYFFDLNRGSIACGEAFPVPMSERLRGDLPQEEYLADPTAGTARRVAWSPNRIEVDVDAARPTELLVNQNWHPGWHASVGEVVSEDGLLAVRLPAGNQRVVLRFLPRSALGGIVVSVVAIAALAWALRRKVRAPLLFGAGAVPVALLILIRLSWHQPAAPPVLRNPDGAPIRVAELPPDAKPIHAHFAVPVELVAAAISNHPDPDGIVHVDLYWKVTGHVPRSAGVFVHLDGPKGEFQSADHEVLSGTYFFENAPRDVLIRDDCAASAADYSAGTWSVKLGLWNVSGDGKRIPVTDARGARPPEERLPIGSFEVPPKPAPDAGQK